MPYSVKLKDQTGAEVIYKSVEKVLLPLDTGTGNAEFMAKYSVTKSPVETITYNGGDSAAHNVDYLCYITSTTTLASSITVIIDGVIVNKDAAYTYTLNADSKSAILKINGASITGKITITASKS